MVWHQIEEIVFSGIRGIVENWDTGTYLFLQLFFIFSMKSTSSSISLTKLIRFWNLTTLVLSS